MTENRVVFIEKWGDIRVINSLRMIYDINYAFYLVSIEGGISISEVGSIVAA